MGDTLWYKFKVQESDSHILLHHSSSEDSIEMHVGSSYDLFTSERSSLNTSIRETGEYEQIIEIDNPHK